MHILSKLFICPLPMMTNLERLVATKAISESIAANIAREVSLDRIAIELTNYNFQTNQMWIFSVILIYIYGKYQYYKGTQYKLNNIRVYDNITNYVRIVLFVIFLVFTRDVQNAI
jgi:hypothetical protein